VNRDVEAIEEEGESDPTTRLKAGASASRT